MSVAATGAVGGHSRRHIHLTGLSGVFSGGSSRRGRHEPIYLHMYTVASATPSCAAWRRRHHVSDGFMCGIASATSATASCAASCQRHQRRLPMRHDVSDISDGFMCGASRSCRASRPLWSRPRQRLFGPSHRAARATCRRSRSVLPCGRECCPRRVFAPCPLKFDGARRAPGRGPARRSPRPPCCSPALSFLCTRAHFTPIKFTAHQAVAGLAILQGSAAGGPVCCPSAMPAGPERRQWPLRSLWYCILSVGLWVTSKNFR